MEFFYLSLLACLFWFFQKLADWHNEHWLKFFKGAWILFGIICGVFWAYLISYSDILQISYFSLLIFWFLAKKIDYMNHIIAWIIMFIWMLYFWEHNYYIYLYSSLIWWCYFLFKVLKNKNIDNLFFKKIFIYRLHFYFIPIIYSIIFTNFFWLVVIFNLFWVNVANKIFKINP